MGKDDDISDCVCPEDLLKDEASFYILEEVEMIIEKKMNGTELIVSPEGRLDSTTSGDLKDMLTENFTEGVELLTLDFSGVDFISSMGLRVLVSFYKHKGTRRIRIVNANKSVLEVLRISGLLKVFEVE